LLTAGITGLQKQLSLYQNHDLLTIKIIFMKQVLTLLVISISFFANAQELTTITNENNAMSWRCVAVLLSLITIACAGVFIAANYNKGRRQKNDGDKNTRV
jgi:hypothetical protein